jgi:HSP20 family protein
MATLVRWEPLRDVAALQNEMSRMVNATFFNDGGTNGGKSWMPALDVWETDKEIVYAFDLPGLAEDAITIEFEDGGLTVSGDRERDEQVAGERFYRYERRFGSFSRTIGLPQGVTEDSIKAEFANGVLEVHVAKPEAPKPRRIQIGGGTIDA